MRNRRPSRAATTVVAVLAALVTTLPLAPAWACSCAFMEPADALDAGAAAAFVGELTSVQPAGKDELGQPALRWSFAVEAVVVGELAPAVDVIAAEDTGANCGLRVAPGERVGLVLHPTDGGWGSSSCSTYDADALLAAGEPRAPDPSLATTAATEPESPPGSSMATWLGLVGITLAALGVLGATVLVARRRRGPAA